MYQTMLLVGQINCPTNSSLNQRELKYSAKNFPGFVSYFNFHFGKHMNTIRTTESSCSLVPFIFCIHILRYHPQTLKLEPPLVQHHRGKYFLVPFICMVTLQYFILKLDPPPPLATYSAATPTGPIGRKLTNRDAN